MKKLFLLITLFFIIGKVISQSYVFDGCISPCYSSPYSFSIAEDLSQDELGDGFIFLIYNYNYGAYIGKLDSTGTEIWEMGYSSRAFYNLANGINNSYYVAGEDTSGDYILSNLSSGGTVIWTKKIQPFSNWFSFNGIKYNKNSSHLVLYGGDYTKTIITDFDSSGTSNWSLSLPQYSITSCVDLDNGSFLFNCINNNNAIVFSVDTSGNILYPHSFSFNHPLNNSKLIRFKDKYFLATQDTTTHEVYLILSNINGQVVNSTKFSYGKSIQINDLILWKSQYLNLFFTRNDTILCLNIDTAGLPFNINYSGYLPHSYDPWYGSGYSTWIRRLIPDSQGIALLEGQSFSDSHMGWSGDRTFISQLDSLGKACINNNISQIYNSTSFSILSNPISLIDTIKQITVWSDSIVNTAVPLTFNKTCGGYATISENAKQTNTCIIFPNPTHQKLFIENKIYDINKSPISITIYNIQGQLIKTITTAEKQTSIDVADLSSGIYIIKAKTEKGIAVKKFIKE